MKYNVRSTYMKYNARSTDMLSLFKSNIKSIFGVRDPRCLRHLFQLTVSLSPLRSHKNPHNFIDTPPDTCHCNQGSEDSVFI